MKLTAGNKLGLTYLFEYIDLFQSDNSVGGYVDSSPDYAACPTAY